MQDDDRYDDDELGTADETTAGTGDPDVDTEREGEDAGTPIPGGGDVGGVVGSDDLDGDVGADVSGAVGPVSQDAGFDEDVPGASPEPAEPDHPQEQSPEVS